MKLPSLQSLAQQSTETFSRFPFALTSAVVGTGASLILIDRRYSAGLDFLHNLSLVGMMGISLFTAIILVAEKLKWGPNRTLLGQVAGVALLSLYYLSLPTDITGTHTTHIIRYFLFGIGLHFLIAVGPFMGAGEVNGFWQFNKSLFLRFLTACLFSSVLYVGLIIAMAAIEHLFNVDIRSERYFELWTFLMGVFNTWFFLAGVPKDLDALDAQTEYPKGLKIFTQYILLPLVFIYVLILYAYTAKIIIEWDWPKGWVGYLVLGFSVTGILTLLLVHPIKERIENAWIRTISRQFYVALIPLVGLLLLAVWRRISEYGMTERRYFVLVLGLWLAGIVVYFIVSKARNIKVIPATLCALAFVCSFGPWGAFSVSERNQVGRLRDVLTKDGILVDGKIRKVTREIPFEESRRISSIVRYLNEVHGVASIQPWFDVQLDTLGHADYKTTGYQKGGPQAGMIVALMGVSYFDEWQREKMENFWFQSAKEGPVDVRGYSHLIRSVTWSTGDSLRTITVDNVEWKFVYSPKSLTITLTAKEPASAALRFALRPMIDSLADQQPYMNSVPSRKMLIEQATHSARVLLHFLSIQGRRVNGKLSVDYIEADILIALGGR